VTLTHLPGLLDCTPKPTAVPCHNTRAPFALRENRFCFSNKLLFSKGELLMSEHNKAIVRRLFAELWNNGNLSVADEIFAPTYTHNDPSTPDFGKGPDSEKRRASLYRNAFPDIHLTIEDVIAEGETVMTRWSCRGTHKGDLNGIAPTGKHITLSGVTIARVSNGKLMEGYVNWDALGMMQQLGVVPQLAKAKVAVAAAR
jgi:steroid delta-isomerase-like uncharacterized protein